MKRGRAAGPAFAVAMLVASTAAHAVEADVCKLNMATGVQRCRVDVKVTPVGANSCDMTIPDAEQKELVLKQQNNIRIVWRLNDGDGTYLFCRQTGDGVFLKDPVRQKDKQIANMRVMKDPDDDGPDTGDEFDCTSRFKWKFKNLRSGATPAGVDYRYEIRARDSTFARTCKLDPFIRNG